MAATGNSALSMIPDPTVHTWGTHLWLADGWSDKEYRIWVKERTVATQWGRRGAEGQMKVQHCADHAEARALARKTWASKEKKGYYPAIGLLTAGWEHPVKPRGVVGQMRSAVLEVAQKLEATRPGRHLALCLRPPAQAGSAVATAIAAKAVPGQAPSGATVLCQVSGNGLSLLTQLCPLVADLGDVDDLRLASELVTELVQVADPENGIEARERFAEAVQVARAVCAS